MATDAASDADAASAAQTPAEVVLTQLRHPGIFTGTGKVDVEDWLTSYERVGKHNKWNATHLLANLIFYLGGTAKVWFETHETEITSWDSCKEKLRDLFGRPVGRQMEAKQELASRVQTPTESYVAYIQDVLALCRKADADMLEADRVGHILKGIADDAFNLLLCRNCSTVESIIKECRNFEQAKSKRIVQRFDRLPNTAATSSCNDPPASHPPATPSLTQVIRRELEAMAPSSHCPHTHDNMTISLIQAVVRQEIANMDIQSAVRPRPTPTTPVIASAAPRQSFPSRYRNPSEWRTPDDRPICFACSRVGHISRHCRSSRWYSSPRPYADRRFDRDPRSLSPLSEPYHAGLPSRGNTTSRSPSPQRRQSRSPTPRRPSSPSYAGRFSGN